MAMHATTARALPTLLAACLAARAAAAGAQSPSPAVPTPGVQIAIATPLPGPRANAPRADAEPQTVAPVAGVAPAAAPDPRLAPDAVVGIVLDALARAGDRAGAAGDERPLALVYAFASPANRAAVGTPDRFAELVRDDAYRPLLGHRRAARGALTVAGDRATQHVLVTAADGARVAYTFTLTRQAAGPFRGCWMTDGVTREAPSRLAAPLSA